MADITTLIDVARGEQPADLLLKNCRVVNTFSGEIKKENLAISQGRILGFGEYNAKNKIDLREQLIAPAFIDGHVHIESSMLSPEQFAAAIIKNGTTTIIADPHEIVNVLGLSGLELFLKRSKGLPVDIHFMMPSCVPATHLETSAHHISATDMKNWKYREEILGLGEMMNYPGVIFKDPGVLNKIRLFDNKIIDGHSPMLRIVCLSGGRY
jgi:adenine deaminase